jgi:xylulokinase
MTLVAGVDSSTQSCKVIVCDADSGEIVRSGTAAHPPGTEVPPYAWLRAFHDAADQAGGLNEVAAIGVGAQQHGMVCLDDSGAVIREALLWNDTRSAAAADQLVAELPGGASAWAEATGSVPVASFTVTKLRWLAEHEPQHVTRTAAVCLPHDWLTWQLRGARDVAEIATDRGDASGTGYWSPATGEYRPDLLELALGTRPQVPTVLPPDAVAGEYQAGEHACGGIVSAGTGDNAAAALGLGARAGDVVVSVGTSGVVCAVSTQPTADPSGMVAGFADATGAFLPLACTLNGAPVLEAVAGFLGIGLDELSRLALTAPAGAGGLVFVPYLDGERTPNRPQATGALHGMRHANLTPATLARAAVEGLLCGLADGLDALRSAGVTANRVLLVGGGARSQALCDLSPAVLGLPVAVPEPGEYVALGAARQAAWALGGDREPPMWPSRTARTVDADPQPQVRAHYAAVRDLTSNRPCVP